MVKKSKLLLALDAHQGRDYEKEKKLRQLKAGEKRKKQKLVAQQKSEGGGSDVENDAPTALRDEEQDNAQADFEAFSDADDIVEEQGSKPNSILRRTSQTTIPQPVPEPQSASEADPDSDIPLSDLSDDERTDTIPHQRLTINNGPALTASRNRILVAKPNMPFQAHNSLISALPASSTTIPDPNDDLTRELEFYRIAKSAALDARTLLAKAKIPFHRPPDYFAEMVKTDEHMALIKRKLYEEAAAKKASSEAKALREAKKFGKRVQVAKEQERAKEKRDTLGKIQELKRKRRGNDDSGDVREDEDLFDKIEVEDAPDKRERGRGGRGGGRDTKRVKKDSKFGFGGKKRYSKSSDAQSTADMSGFSARRMKDGARGRGGGARGGGRGSKRLGKSRRSNA